MFPQLHVITSVSNTERYNSRYRLYQNFAKYCKDSGVTLTTVESAFGDRPFAVTEKDHPNHVQLRTDSQLWHKENMLNIGFSRLPHDWKYAAWIDCDVVFARPDWALETVHQLQHFNVVQMYSHMYDLAPDYTPAPQFYRGVPISYGYNHSLNVIADNRKPTAVDYFGGLKPQHLKSGFYEHPGFAWAITRESYNHLGGLIDWMPVGGADALMAICLTSSRDLPVWALTGNQGRWLLSWRDRCDKYIRGNVGCVPGLLLHNWHGRKAQRQYKDRWKIMTDNNYDPEIDLKRDSQGLWQLTDRSPKLKNDIRNYFRARNEDSIDVE